MQTNFSFRTVNGVKRNTVTLILPEVSLKSALDSADPKSIPFLQELIDTAVYDRVREILADNVDIFGNVLEDGSIETNFPLDELAWEKIINVPAAERKGRGIPKEVWEDFFKDFEAVCNMHSGKTEQQVKNTTALFKAKFAPQKFNKPLLQKMLTEYLTVYAENTARLEDFSDCVEFMSKKLEEFLALDAEAVADAY